MGKRETDGARWQHAIPVTKRRTEKIKNQIKITTKYQIPYKKEERKRSTDCRREKEKKGKNRDGLLVLFLKRRGS
jgi:hypothetical protein